MSRIGKMAIKIPKEVCVETQGDQITVKGPMGSITKSFPGVFAEVSETHISIKAPNDTDKKPIWGTARSCIASMVNGVSTLLKKELLLHGVGIRAVIKGKYISLTLGKSHSFKVEIPDDIKASIEGGNTIVITSFDKEKLSRFAAMVVRLMPPEPYKGKGIRYKDRQVHLKVIRKS